VRTEGVLAISQRWIVQQKHLLFLSVEGFLFLFGRCQKGSSKKYKLKPIPTSHTPFQTFPFLPKEINIIAILKQQDNAII
jgi:hypothetical protein